MPRIKLNIPNSPLVTLSIPVRITDINYGNHVGNNAFVAILHEARAQWLHLYKYTELNIEGAGLIQADLALEFKSEGFYGDIIDITISVGEISNVSFELYYQFYTKRKDESILLLLAKTGMVCYNYSLKKAIPIPEKLKQILLAP
ncbi:MAG: thioesterase family protein [bacterium]